jgi:hypothetical protein
MAQPVWPNKNTESVIRAFPPPQFMARSRREVDTKDAVNARQFEHWQTDGKYGIQNRPDLNKQAPFYDMQPINSRMSERNYSSQPRYDQGDGIDRGGMNPYFDKYDTSFDARNTIRELRSVVYEDKNINYIAESNHLLERNFDNRWFDPKELKETVNAAESLRFKMDDIRTVYINKPVKN